jgi:hypothetical protein
MIRYRRLHLCLATVAVLCLAAVYRSADLDKYLPDRTSFVAVVNVKQIREWPPFEKQIQEQVVQALQTELAQKILKGTGLNPLKDVDRLVLADASPPAEGEEPVSGQVGPTFLLIQGKFDPDKLQAKMDRAEKDWPGIATVRKVGQTTAVQFDSNVGPILVLVLDKETVLATTDEAQAVEALEKAAGKRKTELKYKRIGELLAKADAGRAVEWFACGDHVTSVAATAGSNGKIGKPWRVDLRSSGIESFQGGLTLGEADVRFQTTYFAKDAEAANKMAKKMAADEKEMGQRLHSQFAKHADVAPLIEATDSLKTEVVDDKVTQKGGATPAVVKAILKVQSAPPPGR